MKYAAVTPDKGNVTLVTRSRACYVYLLHKPVSLEHYLTPSDLVDLKNNAFVLSGKQYILITKKNIFTNINPLLSI